VSGEAVYELWEETRLRRVFEPRLTSPQFRLSHHFGPMAASFQHPTKH
jgi:hypothetical protein